MIKGDWEKGICHYGSDEDCGTNFETMYYKVINLELW